MRDVQPIDDALRATHLPLKLAALGLIAVTLSVLILAAAGLYSLMSVVVMQRRREIGIRIALGADRRRVLSSVFSRAAVQLISGVAVGVVIAAIITDAWSGEMAGFNRWVVLSGVALLMLAVGVVAALGPARRGLSIQPIMVLKED
jgi:ABC-type antimicrobial peptide transport system permease subunit